MAAKRLGGTIQLKSNGVDYFAKGTFTYNLGVAKKEMIVGSDRVHGYKAVPQKPMIEGVITDTDGLDLKAFQELVDQTVTLDLFNGKTIVLVDAVYAADGDVTTEEGEIQCKFEGTSAREIS